jgi:hypothetical protein
MWITSMVLIAETRCNGETGMIYLGLAMYVGVIAYAAVIQIEHMMWRRKFDAMMREDSAE